MFCEPNQFRYPRFLEHFIFFLSLKVVNFSIGSPMILGRINKIFAVQSVEDLIRGHPQVPWGILRIIEKKSYC